ncbi:hypothetical protein HOM13_00435 [Candidatus Woesearchaeota archaeon]|jgi:hypothetical protein|nr:hypothetical protein [Candidatus Woesearchaeota archaeon]MBT5215185.1 hypothetical protein [Candidatus Woesearchaeota archaeon]MBT6402302.1 hypothetical protein [Candidatus Woesearchaeota archaeon]
MAEETHQLTKKERSILKQKRREERQRQKNEESIQREKALSKKSII